MKNKNKVFSYFQSLFAFVKTQFSLTIKGLRTYGGGEYMSNKFKDFFTTQGIMYQISCPHTPEQNGISKRKNRHIRETAVTMIQTAFVPSHFWYHACTLATYLINRMSTPMLDMFSPFERLYNKSPDLNILRVFGCVCYPLLTPYRVDKLQLKTPRCIFMGFSIGYKGFICYNPGIKRDIMFHDMCSLMKTIIHVLLLPLYQGLLTLINNLQYNQWYSLISLSLSPLFIWICLHLSSLHQAT